MGRPETGQSSALGLEYRKTATTLGQICAFRVDPGKESGIVFHRPNEKELTGEFLILLKKTAWMEFVWRMRKICV